MKAKSISITISTEGNSRKKVVLEGQLTIRHADLIRKKLLSLCKSSDSINVVLKNVVKIDLTAFQLLIALQKSAAIHKIDLSYELGLPDNLKPAFFNSGLLQIPVQE